MAEHNSQWPVAISHLPSEIFVEIFTYSMDCESDTHPNSILLLTHVCRQWRDIILNCPLFWSCPDFSRPLLAKEMIQRSKPGPLDLRFDHHRHEWQILPSNMLSIMTEASPTELPRIRTLKLRFTANGNCIPFFILRQLVSLLTQRMPLLESLSVRSSNDEVRLELPTHILAGGSPRLKELDLSQCRFPWGSPIFPNLTTLTLHGDKLPNGVEFLQTLGGSPLLEHLSLTDVFPLSIPKDAMPAVIELHHLKRLHLEVIRNPAQTHSCIETLRRLSFPQTVSVGFGILYDESESASSSFDLFRVFFEKVTSLGEARMLRLFAEFDDAYLGMEIFIDFEIWTKAIPFEPEKDFLDPFNSGCHRTHNTSPSFRGNIDWFGGTPDLDEDDAPMQNIVREMMRSLSMRRLDTLDLREFPKAEVVLDSLVDSMTVRCLVIGKESIYGFIRCMSVTPSAFPALRDLGLFDVDFQELIDPEDGLFESLVSALEARPEKFERLMIDKDHGLGDLEIERLEGVAVVMVFRKMRGTLDLHRDYTPAFPA